MRLTVSCLAGLVLWCASVAAADEDPNWQRVKIDETFRSEGVAAVDVNRDGKIDVLAGDVWYEAPDWTMHEIRTVGKYEYDKGYSQSFADFAYDVNADGWPDLIIVGFPAAPFHWYENPKGNYGQHWTPHLVWHSGANETPVFTNLVGDSRPELVVGSEPERQLGYLTLPDAEHATQKWTFHPVSEPGDPRQNGSFRFYHGLGVGDLNGDGRNDVLIPHGWYEQPAALDTPWTFHGYTLSESGQGNPLPAANLLVQDLDLDGDNDIVMSSAHNYGLWWFENLGDKQNTKFQYHLIDKSYSQTHALEFADINGDGQKDLVTGKRFYAHQGHDPGGKEPVVMYWYEIQRQKGQPPKFLPHEIVAGRDTGIGTQFQVTDMNGDGRLDLVLSNKKGVNVLLQKGAK